MTKLELLKLGFNNLGYYENGLVVRNFKLYPELPQSGKEYYTYPKGIISGYRNIKINKQNSRIQSIHLPVTDIPSPSKDAFIGMLSYFVDDYCRAKVEEKEGMLNLMTKCHTNAEKVLDQLIIMMFQAHCVYDEEKNYVSHIGRLMPIIMPYLSVQIRQFLLTSRGDLQLLDILVDAPTKRTINLKLPSSLITAYANKKCREERGLLKIVDKHLHLKDSQNVIERGENFTSEDIKKINFHKEHKTPFYIAATTGMHAFSVKVDFVQSILYVANPLGRCDNFDAILQDIEVNCGFRRRTWKWANTKRLDRISNIDIDDTCTADAYALIKMMIDYPVVMVEGCLDDQPLLTGRYAQEGLALEMKTARTYCVKEGPELSISKEVLAGFLMAYRPTSWTGFILYILTLGYHRSGTIRALDNLCARKNKGDLITKSEMIEEISKPENNDTRQNERLGLFNQHLCDAVYDDSGTDRVIQLINFSLQ